MIAGVIAALAGSAGALAQPTDLLPDIIVRENELYDNLITGTAPRLLRMSNATANRGTGKLYLYGGAVLSGDKREVWQRVYRTDGTSWDRLAGVFLHHPSHGHIHYNDWCQYRLRARPTEDEVGPVVREGAKTSFCILDLFPYDPSLPGYPPNGQFNSCGTSVQGLSVGWMDEYSKDLDGQWVDITGVPDGAYWLESEVDPNNDVLESNETNNVTRIKIVINNGSTVAPDRFEPNNTTAIVNGRPVGQVNSPNLGPTGPVTVLNALTVNNASDFDYYRFYNPGTGTGADFVRIDFQNFQGNLSLHLYNSGGTLLSSSTSSSANFEQISLSGRAPGYYYVRASGSGGETSPAYALSINPAASPNPPVVTVTSPPVGDVRRLHSIETYRVDWAASDADSNPTWVSVYLNTTPALDGNEILIPTSLNTDGALGFHVVNSAYVAPGTYWVYCKVTDGGVVTGDWSSGTVTFVTQCPADFNGDTFVDGLDSDQFNNAFEAGDTSADFNNDGFVDGIDYDLFMNAFEAGC